MDRDCAIQRLEVEAGGRAWLVERHGDLESLWDAMDGQALDADERLPYWVELWPASLLLADWLAGQGPDLAGLTCLDLGCGLGLTAMVAAHSGARVLGLDYEWQAVAFARRNARLNGGPQPVFCQMDWRQPGLRPGSFQRVWGGDILYEKRFFEPLESLFRHVLAPGGLVWIAEPVRDVSGPVWDRLSGLDWDVELVAERSVPAVTGGDYSTSVRLWQMSRGPAPEGA